MCVHIQKKILAIIVNLFIVFNAIAEPLTMEQAVELALKSDPIIVSFQEKEQAFREASIASSALPDPKVKLGLMNFPTDTYKRNQEPMTQVQVGLSQMFPAGDSLEIKSNRQIDFANAELAKTMNRQRMIKRSARKAWLELYYWTRALSVVKENKTLFKNLLNVTESNYAAGRQQQQDVIRTSLELELLNDKEIDISSNIEKAKSKLAKLIGQQNSSQKLTNNLPLLTTEKELFSKENIDTHPSLQIKNAMVSASQNSIELAKQSYKPNWMLDVTYGARDDAANGIERADFLSAMVKFSVPLFTSNFQDRKVAASKRRHHAALNQLEDKKRDLLRMYQTYLSDYKQYSERSERYKKVLLVKARQNAYAALSSYQSDRGKFTDLIRARMTELNMQLKALRLEINRYKSHSDLLYLVGEQV